MQGNFLIDNVIKIPFLGKRLLNIYLQAERRKSGGGVQAQIYSPVLRQYTARLYKVHIGNYSYGSCFEPQFNIGGKEVHIGNYCSFANDVRYCGADHPMNYVCMHPFFYNSALFKYEVKDIERKTLKIGHGCWIGERAIITAGCREIGNGAVVGAGSVVTHDVLPYAVVTGNPARILKFRFSPEEIRKLEETLWWDKSPAFLKNFYPWIDDIMTFTEKWNTMQ